MASHSARDRRPPPSRLRVTYATGEPLVMRANREFRRDLRRCRDWIEREALVHESLKNAGMMLADADKIPIGLTSAPFISDTLPTHTPETGLALPPDARVWWYERYQIEDFTERLRDDGHVAFDWGE